MTKGKCSSRGYTPSSPSDSVLSPSFKLPQEPRYELVEAEVGKASLPFPFVEQELKRQ